MGISEHFWLWFAASLGIGLLVSIDVGCLVRSQYRDFAYDRNANGEPVRHVTPTAVMHATWHAIFFIIYMVVINFAVTYVPDFIVVFLNKIGIFLKSIGLSIPPDILQTLAAFDLFVGMIIILFVWYTYSEKIVDNHSSNTGISGPRIDRIDLKIFHRLLRALPLVRRFWDHALAFTVAVDMLAISALIRVYFEGAADTGFGQNDPAAHFSIIEPSGLLVDVLMFAAIIWVVVFLVAYFVGRHAQKSNQEANLWFLFGLRLLEPLLLFGVAGYALAHIFLPPAVGPDGQPMGRSFLVLSTYAILMTISLFIAKSWKDVRDAVDAGRNITVENFAQDSKLRLRDELAFPFKWIWKNRRGLAVGIIIFVVLSFSYVICFTIAKHFKINNNIYVGFISIFSIWLGALSCFILFVPRIGSFIESYTNLKFFVRMRDFRHYFFNRSVLGLYFAYLVTLEFLQFSQSGSSYLFGLVSGGARSEEVHALFGLMLFHGGVLMLFNIRAIRARRLSSSRGSRWHNRKLYNMGELLTCIGMAAFLFQFII
jgi:hypothetical protein